MQTTVKLLHIFPQKTGTGKNGEWKKQDIVGESKEQYPKKICFTIWGDKVDESYLTLNQDYIIDFDIESREYNGKWYTDIKVWKMSTQEN